MILTVMRHGTAADEAARDCDRVLTVEGRDEVRRVAAVLVEEFSAPPDIIVSSPYVRAIQTAELLAAVVSYLGVIDVSRALEPEAPPVGARDLAESLRAHAHVMLVSHEPLLSTTCGLLLGTRFPGLRRAEVLSMRFDPLASGGFGPAALRFRVDPRDPRCFKRL